MWTKNQKLTYASIWRPIPPLSMQELQSLLGEIGLNPYETAIYMQLLYGGEQAASVLSRTLKMPRSTTRGLLDKLCERGIVHKIYKRNTQYYSCKPPRALLEHLRNGIQEKKRSIKRLREAMPVLTSLHQRRNLVPKVQIFEGPEQVIEAFNQSLYIENLKELLIFTSYEFLRDPLIKKNDDELFIKMRVKKGIHARVLVGKTSESSKMIKKDLRELRERRFLPERFRLPGNIHIYGDTVLYFSTQKGQYLSVLVQGAQMADTLRTLFEFMWEQCKE